jgi:hypothetical protein
MGGSGVPWPVGRLTVGERFRGGGRASVGLVTIHSVSGQRLPFVSNGTRGRAEADSGRPGHRRP